MDKVFLALRRATTMMFTPKVWLIVGKPIVLSLLFWGVVIGLTWWLGGDSVSAYVEHLKAQYHTDSSWWRNALTWIATAGALIGVVLLSLFLIVISSILMISIFGMNSINHAVAQRYFPSLAPSEGLSTWATLKRTILWTFGFAFFWIVSTPAYLVAGLGAVIQTIASARYNQKVFTMDALSNHAKLPEYEWIQQNHQKGLFSLGLIVTLMGSLPAFILMGSLLGVVLIPLTALISVVIFTTLSTFCGLAFSCYCLQALVDLRTQGSGLIYSEGE